MSSPDAQPPLTRRQARERERAAHSGDQAVVPDTNEPASVPASATSASFDNSMRRRPGSHAAVVAPREAAAPVQPPAVFDSGSPESSAAPGSRSTGAEAQSSEAVRPVAPQSVAIPPASATEIVPGTGLTRRQLRALRAAQEHVDQPVPLQAPSPQSSDRTVADVLGTVRAIEVQKQGPDTDPGVITGGPVDASSERSDEHGASEAFPAAHDVDAQEVDAEHDDVKDVDALDDRALEVADQPVDGLDTGADDDAAELADAASTSTPAAAAVPTSVDTPPAPADVPQEVIDAVAAEIPSEDPPAQSDIALATVADASPEDVEPLADAAAEAAAHGEEPRRHRSTWSPSAADDAPVPSERAVPELSLPSDLPNPTQPAVFPLDLEDDDDADDEPSRGSNESSAPTVEPKALTVAFQPPAGHWSRQVVGGDAEIHDEETGVRRVADTNTNALILPNSVLSDVTGALNATGEVILTGSIDLPKSLSSTGSHRPIDGAEVDRMLDSHDEIPDTDAAPVRASKAISSHTSTRAVVLAAASPKDSKTPVVLAVSAASVGVAAVIAVVVTELVFHWI
jgi:hypothetical protein